MTEALAKKIFAVQQAIKGVEKAGYNKAQNYNYVKGDDVVGYVRGVLFEHNLMVVPSSVDSIDFRDTQGKMFVTTICINYIIHDIESGESTVVKWGGCGADTGDKGIYKAYTGALKYFFIDYFLIPVGIDPDDSRNNGRNDDPPPAPFAWPDGISNRRNCITRLQAGLPNLHPTESGRNAYIFGATKQSKLEDLQNDELAAFWLKFVADYKKVR